MKRKQSWLSVYVELYSCSDCLCWVILTMTFCLCWVILIVNICLCWVILIVTICLCWVILIATVCDCLYRRGHRPNQSRISLCQTRGWWWIYCVVMRLILSSVITGQSLHMAYISPKYKQGLSKKSVWNYHWWCYLLIMSLDQNARE